MGTSDNSVKESIDAVGEILRRRNFNTDLARRVLTIVGHQGIINILLILGFFGLLYLKPDPLVVAATEDGRIIPLTPTNQPLYNEGTVARFAADAFMAATSYGFADYKVRLGEARKFFTDSGWEGYEKSLKESGNLKTILESQLMATGTTSTPPIVVKQGLDKKTNLYLWVVEFNGVQIFESAIEKYQKNLRISMVIVRQPITKKSVSEDRRGLGVHMLSLPGS